MAKRVSWRALLERVASDVQESGGQLSCTCPFCRHHRVSFYVHARKGLWNCKYCGRRGRGKQLVDELRKLGLLHDALALATDDEDDELQPAAIKLPDEFERLRFPITAGNRRFWRYATRRHLTPELVQTYHIGFCRTGRYAGRLIVPVTHGGQLVSFVARAIARTEPRKIMTPPGNRQSQYLFNLERCVGDCVTIVEGVFDCLVLPEQAVASLGKRLTDAQVQLLVAAGYLRVNIAWDADAQREAEDAAARLIPLADVRMVMLTEGDPSELGRDAMLRAIADAEAVPSSAQRAVAWGRKERGRD